MRLWKSSKWRRWMRAAHRDVGYFFIGACVVYAVSGLVLSLRSFGIDLANSRTAVEVQLPKGLPADSLASVWEQHRGALPSVRSVRAEQTGAVRMLVPGARLEYDQADGVVRGEVVTPRWGLSLFNRLHFNRYGAWEWMGVFFAVGLLLLTITGAVMLSGRQGFLRRGVWIMFAGVVVMVVAAVV